MSVPVKLLAVGQQYVYKARNIKIIQIDDSKKEPLVTYEYFLHDDSVGIDQCSVKDLAHHALIDFTHDPDYMDFYPFLFSKRFKSPEMAAGLLNKKIKRDGKMVTVKDAVKSLVDRGYRPAKNAKTFGLFHDDDFISIKEITKAGMFLAEYLSEEQGWDGKISKLPDILIN